MTLTGEHVTSATLLHSAAFSQFLDSPYRVQCNLPTDTFVIWVIRGAHKGIGELVDVGGNVALIWFPRRSTMSIQNVDVDDVYSL